MYSIILYVGVSLMLIGFFLFMWCEVRDTEIDRELSRNKRLGESFLRNKKMERKKW